MNNRRSVPNGSDSSAPDAPLGCRHGDQSSAVIVLLDPTSDDGETALAAIGDRHTRVSLVVLTSGPCSSAIRDMARADGIELAEAAWNYLEQIEQFVAAPGRQVELVVAKGPDAGVELGLLAADLPEACQVVPESVFRRDRWFHRQLGYLPRLDICGPTVTVLHPSLGGQHQARADGAGHGRPGPGC